MIGTDLIIISKEYDPMSIGYGQDRGEMVFGYTQTSFTFGDFQNMFRVRRPHNCGIGEMYNVVFRAEDGERWELVN